MRVVDDNDINLPIVDNALQNFGGIKVELVKSGKDAIDAIEKNDCDIVFMDHMMPEMDGVEATLIIRKMQGRDKERLPIIALPANAITGAKDLILGNGMNDFCQSR